MNTVVVFGGKSTEHDVSCVSASSVLKNIKNHNVLKIGITEQGKWYYTEADTESIADGSWEKCAENKSVCIDFNNSSFVWDGGEFKPDVIFPVLHGKNGEDGTVQGLFELMNVPYVGCRVLGSSVCMDKAFTKIIFAQAGINQVDWQTVERFDYFNDKLSVIDSLDKNIGYPMFVKPSNAGSSVGISKCKNKQEVSVALDLAFDVDRRVVVEKGIENPLEIEVAVMGNDDPIASVSGRIIPANEFYDFEAKYSNDNSKLLIPSGFADEEFIKKEAVKAYKACDCKGFSRVDFLVDGNGTVYLNEINTIPGFTSISMFPKLFGASGIEYSDLIEKLLDYAVDFSK